MRRWEQVPRASVKFFGDRETTLEDAVSRADGLGPSQNLKPAPTPCPVMTGSTLLDDGAGVDIVEGTATGRLCAAVLDADETVLPPRESLPAKDGGGGISVRGRTP